MDADTLNKSGHSKQSGACRSGKVRPGMRKVAAGESRESVEWESLERDAFSLSDSSVDVLMYFEMYCTDSVLLRACEALRVLTRIQTE